MVKSLVETPNTPQVYCRQLWAMFLVSVFSEKEHLRQYELFCTLRMDHLDAIDWSLVHPECDANKGRLLYLLAGTHLRHEPETRMTWVRRKFTQYLPQILELEKQFQ
jgi:hypothetical protein